MLSTEFLVTSLIVIFIPGTGVIYTVSTGLFHGWRKSMVAALGCTLGIVPHLLASALGLAALVHASALAFQTVKYIGVAYLFYLSFHMWQDTGKIYLPPEQKRSPKNGFPILTRGILINILNPKLSIFFLAFLPQFISHSKISPLLQMLILSLIFMAMTLLVFIVYGLSAHAISTRFFNSSRSVLWMKRTFAVCFAAIGLKLAAVES